jgi:hypothetical protein
MSWIKSVTREIIGLFVDDGSFALAILVCVVIAVTLLARLGHQATWTGPALFAALACILIESALRFANQRK